MRTSAADADESLVASAAVPDKRQTRREAGTQSKGPRSIEVARLPKEHHDMHTTIARVIALAAATLLVVPATALARGGHDDPAPAAAVVPAGQDDQTSETEGAGQSTDGAALEHAGGDDASPGADDSAGTGQEGAHGHGRHGRRSQDVRASKRFDLRGTVISADASAETVVITVTKANHNGR